MTSQDAEQHQNLRERHRALTRESLIDATVAASAEDGFAAVTVDQIVRRAGVSRPTFYLHFAAKNEVAREVSQRLDALVVALYEALPGCTQDPASLEGWMRSAAGYWADNSDSIATVQQAVAVDADLNHDVEARIARYASMLASCIGARHGGAEDRRVIATTLILQLERVCYFWKVRDWDFPDHTVRVLTDQWSAYLE